ncbi:MAG: hypothetical protein EZS28_047959 [Streblomastix strix]|uniref:Uncharacterized protein n=1 Tax=Streblomastix strix TaxID=222440 RepID=A0A5J4TGC3_9EUKA|nr:MAG: hypothetical protein EZS28_047959 [Streblomastix strix]
MENNTTIAQTLWKETWLTKFDLIEAHSHLPISEIDQQYLSFEALGEKFRYMTLPFGIFCTSAVFIQHMSPLDEDTLIKATSKALAKKPPEKPRKKRYPDPEPVVFWLEQQLPKLCNQQKSQRLVVQFILIHSFRFVDCERMQWNDIDMECNEFTVRVPAKSDLTVMKETVIIKNDTRKGVCTFETIEF